MIDISFPRPLTALHQLELSSRCNLACSYCPHHIMQRPQVDMTWETFQRCLEWVDYFVKRGTQSELNLAGLGESTLHPEFPRFIAEARLAVRPEGKLIFATNGLLIRQDVVDACVRHNARVWVSVHKQDKAALAADAYKKAGVLDGLSIDPTYHPNDWAGQVRWPCGEPLRCIWVTTGRGFAAADGTLLACCIDAHGVGKIGHVNDEIGSVKTQPYALCRSCYQKIDVPGFCQERSGDKS